MFSFMKLEQSIKQFAVSNKERNDKQTNPELKMLYRKRGTKSLLHKEKDFS